MMRPVPETAVGDLEERVAALAEKRRAEIEQLVRQRLDLIVQEVLEAELRVIRPSQGLNTASNGNGAVDVTGASAAPVTRICAECGVRAAERHRTRCSKCRHTRAREAETEPPLAGAGGVSGAGSRADSTSSSKTRTVP
jgi:hypothetical protein